MSYVQGGTESLHTRGNVLKRFVSSGFLGTLHKMLFLDIPRSVPG